MGNISLTASMRSNLLSLQNTQSLMDTTQNRLSSGLKVNSAIDNPSSYYTAQSLNNRASDLSALMDSMGQGIQTLKAADEAIKSITKFAEQAKAVANSARDVIAEKKVTTTGTFLAAAGANTITIDGEELTITGAAGEKEAAVATKINAAIAANAKLAGRFTATGVDDSGSLTIEAVGGAKGDVSGTIHGLTFAGTADTSGLAQRDKYATQFNSILGQIDQLAKDAGYKGVNLLQGNDLKVIFNEDRSSVIDIKGKDASSSGLKINKAADAWTTDASVDTAVADIEGAISELRTMASEFGNNYSVVQNREEFTKNLVNVLTEGADKLTLADMNEESANMLALQTRQQLAINSLSLASQAAQSVLKLF